MPSTGAPTPAVGPPPPAGWGRPLHAGRHGSGAVASPPTARRFAKALRPVWEVKATSARSRSSASSRSRRGGGEAASSAASVRAENVKELPRTGRGPDGTGSDGASSSTTWTLVPPRPKELTPARRGAPSAGPGPGRRRRTGRSKSICGFGASKWRLGGMVAVLQRQRRLDQPGDAGRRLEVADVGLHRADGAERRCAACRRGTPA